jgi:hypothetical protein
MAGHEIHPSIHTAVRAFFLCLGFNLVCYIADLLVSYAIAMDTKAYTRRVFTTVMLTPALPCPKLWSVQARLVVTGLGKLRLLPKFSRH